LETRQPKSQVFNKCIGCNFISPKKKSTKQGLFENEPCANFKKGVRGVGHFHPRAVGERFIIILHIRSGSTILYKYTMCIALNGKPGFTI